MLSGAIVDPEGSACPNFMPKIEIVASQPAPPQIQRAWRLPAHPQQFSPPLGYVPYPWAPSFMIPRFNFPWPYMEYERPIYGYGRQPYPLHPSMLPSPFWAPPELLEEELAVLEAYKRELQAEIEEINARIRELKRWIRR